MPPVLLIALAVPIGVLILFFLVRSILDRRRVHLERRLGGQDEEARTGLLPSSIEHEAEGVGERSDAFENMIARTGLDLTGTQALSIIALTGLTIALVIYAWQDDFLLAAMGMAVGLLIPYGVFLFLQNRRQQMMQTQLPDVFYSFARSLRAGLSLEHVLGQAGHQTIGPLGQEFRLCYARMQLGLRPSSALQMMADRVQLLDFNIFVSTVSLYYTSGGNLATLLDRLASTTRDRNQFFGYFRSSTALGRIAAIFIASAAPVILLVYFLFQPTHIGDFLRSPFGWQCIGIAMVLEVIGIVWTMTLLRVDY